MNSKEVKERILQWFRSIAVKIFDFKVFEKFLEIHYRLKDTKIFKNRFSNPELTDTLEKFRQYCESAVGASQWNRNPFTGQNGYYKFYSDLYNIEFCSKNDRDSIARSGHTHDLVLILLSMGILSEELDRAKDAYSAREFETVTEILLTINPTSAEKTEGLEEKTLDLKNSIRELQQKNERLFKENHAFQGQIEQQQQTLKDREQLIDKLKVELKIARENNEVLKTPLKLDWLELADGFSLKIRGIPGQDPNLCICHRFKGKDIETTIGSTP